MTGSTCEKCGNALALAESQCSRCGAAVVQNPLALRRLGIRLESESQLARAGNAFRSALALNDSDEIAHQLFIANLGKQGLLSEARKFYEARLQTDPADAVALKQLNVIKLSADFLAKPPPTAAVRHPTTAMERWLKPSPLKIGLAASVLLLSLAMFFVSLNRAGTPPSQAGYSEEMDLYAIMPHQFGSLLFDKTLWAFQAGLSALGLYFMHRNR